MTAPTVNLTVTVNTPAGAAVSGAIVTAMLSAMDIYDGATPNIVVQPVAVQATSNGAGLATLALFPNSLGTENTFYNIEAWTSDLATLIFRTTCVLPNTATDLATIWGTVPAATTFEPPLGPPTVVAVQQGGTGASTAAGALANLGITIDGSDATVLHTTDIGVTVEAYDATTLKAADIGVTVEGYDATILKDADIGVSVQAYDATILNAADIGVTVQAYDAAIVNKDVSNNWTAAQQGTPVALTSSVNSIEIDLTLGNNYTHTLTENTTIINPTNPEAGQAGVIVFTQHATTPKTLAFGSYWKFQGGVAPALTTTGAAVDVLSYYVESTTRITCVMLNDSK